MVINHNVLLSTDNSTHAITATVATAAAALTSLPQHVLTISPPSASVFASFVITQGQQLVYTEQASVSTDASPVAVGTLSITGYLRSSKVMSCVPMSANQLVHITGHGDYQIDRITQTQQYNSTTAASTAVAPALALTPFSPGMHSCFTAAAVFFTLSFCLLTCNEYEPDCRPLIVTIVLQLC